MFITHVDIVLNFLFITHVDIPECQNGEARCHSFAQCENTPGSYRCVCLSGYQFATDQHTCIGKCIRVHFMCTYFDTINRY